MPRTNIASRRRALVSADIPSLRLHSHRLIGAAFAAPDDVVQWLGAVQAQDYHGAKWALALRARMLTSAAIDRAFDAGTILRTHVMRPTWHFVAPQDLRWLLALTSPRVHAANARLYRQFELDDTSVNRAHRLMARALSGGRARTRPELATILAKGGIAATGIRLAFVVMHAELSGLVCSGPLRGKQHTYMLVEERVRPTAALTREEALATLARRYFTSHGPATARDFAWWSGLTMVDARRGVAMVGSAMESLEIEGDHYWFAPAANAGRANSTVHLLPNYDEHVVAYRDHGHTLDADAHQAIRDRRARPPGAHLIARDGRVIGGWQRSIARTGASVVTQLLIPLGPHDRRALAAAAAAFGRFLELPVSLGPA